MTVFPYNALILLTLLFAAYLLSEIKKGETLRHFLFLSKTQWFCWLAVCFFVVYETLAVSSSLPCLPRTFRFIIGNAVLFLLSFSIFQKIKRKEKNIFIVAGLWLVIAGQIVAADDTQRYRMLVVREANDIGLNEKKEIVRMPFQIRILTVEQEFYPSGKPKLIKAELLLQQNGIADTISISPNHPAGYHGYDLYLQKTNPDASMILLVRQPWKYLLYIGFTLLLAGCFIQIIQEHRKTCKNIPFVKPWHFPIFLFFAVIFCLVNLVFPKLFPWELPPTLQSDWFIPHIIAYLFAYALLLLGGVEAFVFYLKYKDLPQNEKIIRMGTSFFAIGLIFGALWAKVAWGDFWNWDAKEMWALTTLVLCEGYLMSYEIHPRKKSALWLLFIALLALQMCWYGVNFLPEAPNLHRYS